MKITLNFLLGGLIGILSACDAQQEATMVGTLERHRIEIRAQHSEPIIHIAATEGSVVEAGTLLVQQDVGRVGASLAAAEAQVIEARARLAELQRGPRQETIERARAQLAATHADLQHALLTRDRSEDLYRRGLAAQASRDEAHSNWKRLTAALEADAAALRELEAGTTVEVIAQAQARLDQAIAVLTQRQVEVERLSLRAPTTARVDTILHQVGETPAVGATVVVLLAEETPWARIYVPHALRSQLRVGDTLRVRIDGYQQVFEGTLRQLSSDPAFTPYFALTEHDRGRLSYLAEVDLPQAQHIPNGQTLEAWLTPRQ